MVDESDVGVEGSGVEGRTIVIGKVAQCDLVVVVTSTRGPGAG